MGEVRVAGGVDDATGQHRFAAGLGLRDHAAHRAVLHHRSDDQAMEHRRHPGLLDQEVGDDLEALGVDLVRLRLALRHRGPEPTTSTSVWCVTSTSRAGSRTVVPMP
jgi:hypothetical protein